jgi:release factor glutamine methyltransferase
MHHHQQSSNIKVSLKHFKSIDYKQFYEPNDDTWLFTDALQNEYEYIRNTIKPNICLEVGSGSGYVSTYLNKLITQYDDKCLFYCTDINPNAANATFNTMEQNGIDLNRVDVVLSSFMTAMLPRLKNKIDILLFNPPYVPSEDEEVSIPCL